MHACVTCGIAGNELRGRISSKDYLPLGKNQTVFCLRFKDRFQEEGKEDEDNVLKIARRRLRLLLPNKNCRLTIATEVIQAGDRGEEV